MTTPKAEEKPFDFYAGADRDDDDIMLSPGDRGDAIDSEEAAAAQAAADEAARIAAEEEAARVAAEEAAKAASGKTEEELAAEAAALEAVRVAEEEAAAAAAAAAAQGAADAEVTKARSDQKIMMPKARYDKQKARADKLQQDLEALQAQHAALLQGGQQQQRPPAVDPSEAMDALNTQYNEAIIDGRIEDAKGLFAQMMRQIQREAVELAQVNVQATQVRQTVEQELDAAAETIATRFPELDDFNEDAFDATLAAEVQAITRTYVQSKLYPPGEALTRAAEMVMQRERPDYFASAGTPAAVPAKPPAPSTPPTAPKAAVQPPGVPAQSVKAPVFNIATMSEADFDRLTEDQLAEMRGDKLA